MSTNQNNGTAVANRPVHQIRLKTLTASIWENESRNNYDVPMYGVVVQRSYVDSSGAWQNTTSMNEDDLLYRPELDRLCWHWIQRRKAALRNQQPTNGGVERTPTPPAVNPNRNLDQAPATHYQAEQARTNGNGNQHSIRLSTGQTAVVSPEVAAEFAAMQERTGRRQPEMMAY